MGAKRQVNLARLSERIRAIEARHAGTASAQHQLLTEAVSQVVPTGWPEVDVALGGGLCGGLHEWLAESEDSAGRSRRRWLPPLCILTHLGWQVLTQRQAWTVWIGQRCHPYPRILLRQANSDLLERSLFAAPPDASTRLWAIDLALRSPAVGCVIADGGDFDRAATQRIAWLARTHGKIALTARPAWQQDRLSAAQTRWRVQAVPSDGEPGQVIQLRWTVELLRCKGMRPAPEHPVWLLEWNRAQSALHLSTRLADLAGAPQKQAVGESRTA